jgi:hypothetical protein
MCRRWSYSLPSSVSASSSPSHDPSERVGDHEREQVCAELRAHFTEGRLSVDEFSDRLDYALRASTAGELEDAVRDLPPVTGYVRPWEGQTQPATVPPLPRRWAIAAAYAHLRSYIAVMAFLVLIWALTGFGYFWPAWPMVIWGFFAIRHAWWARSQTS